MEAKNKGSGHRKYDAQFKADVLKMLASGQSVAYVFHALGRSENLIYRWKQKRKGENKEVLKGDSSSLWAENEQLKDRVRQLETERDILKKTLSIFSR
ncbi:transposase [soil metagenome]